MQPALLIDTRQKRGKHRFKDCYFEAAGLRKLHVCLPYGDYMRMPENLDSSFYVSAAHISNLYDWNETIPPNDRKAVVEALRANGGASVDTKQNMQELYGDLVQQHERFSRECELGGENLYILVEQGGIDTLEGVLKWRNPRTAMYYRNKKLGKPTKGRPPVKNASLVKTMETMTEKYGTHWVFCSPEDAPKKILEILGFSA